MKTVGVRELKDRLSEYLRRVRAGETLIECDRVLHRAVHMNELTEVEAADRHAPLVTVASHWHVLRIAPEIVERARRPFPA